MSIEIFEYKSASDFLAENEEDLLENESFNNLILGLANRIKFNEKYGEYPIFLCAKEGHTPIGQAMRSHPDKPLAVTLMPEEATHELVNFIQKRDIKIQGIVGPIKICKDFISRADTPNPSLEMLQGVYEVTKIQMPLLDEVSMTIATEKDKVVCESFIEGFIKDCFPKEKEVTQRAKKMLDRSLTAKSLFLLKNPHGETLSMACKVRESRNAATVSLVYTPNKYRNNGYGSMITALVSEYLLSNGKDKCNLFTDLSNPTSNSIYQKIGYRKIGENIHYSFEQSSD